MAESIAMTRARIACRIYLALYDAGAEGLTFMSGANYLPGVLIPDDPSVVTEVVQKLRDLGAIRERDSAHPGSVVLHPDLLHRMDQQVSYPVKIVDRLRRDLTAIDRGNTSVLDEFLGLESMVRTGRTHARDL